MRAEGWWGSRARGGRGEGQGAMREQSHEAGSSNRGEKREGANHITAFNVIYPKSAICFTLCSARLNGQLQQIYSSDQLFFNKLQGMSA